MNTLDPLRDIIDACEKLTGASFIHHMALPNDIVGIILQFSSSMFVISVTDQDELYFSNDIEKQSQIKISKADKLFDEASGKTLRWFWELINNQGYRDGLQLEFANSVEDRPFSIQIIAIASRLSLRSSKEIN
jgi:hypothetical protein